MEHSRFLKAALTGDVDSLRGLLKQLDGPPVNGDTPLHLAILYGHIEFAEEILRVMPQLASTLDSAQHSALYLAAMKGHVEIVKLLLEKNPAMCLVQDHDGMTPLHAAALKGRVEIVKEITGVSRIASRVLSNTREPILHMCVNHERFDVVKALLECMNDDHEFLKMKDDDDNTILHVAVAKKHILLTEYLLEKTMMKEQVNAVNIYGMTALDVLLQNKCKSINDMKLQGLLRRNKARKGRAMMTLSEDSWMDKPSNFKPHKDAWKKHEDWLNDTRSSLMIVAILIATVTFQVGVNPPGGVWQEDKDNRCAGKSIMFDKYPSHYKLFATFNFTGFLSSVLIIWLLMSGFPLKRRFFMWTLVIITWMAISSMIVSYGYAYLTVTPEENAAVPSAAPNAAAPSAAPKVAAPPSAAVPRPPPMLGAAAGAAADAPAGPEVGAPAGPKVGAAAGPEANHSAMVFIWFFLVGLFFIVHIILFLARRCFNICSRTFKNKFPQSIKSGGDVYLITRRTSP